MVKKETKLLKTLECDIMSRFLKTPLTLLLKNLT